MTDEPADSQPHADEGLLDALLDRLVRDFADGRDVDARALLPDRPDLADRVRELIDVAKEIAPRRPPERPTFAGYEILRELGRGGMGQVMLARHVKLGRTVALKVLPRRLATGKARERFEREARAVARLEHPLIVPIYDLGEEDGQPYFTMAYVVGTTLSAVLHSARGRDAASLAGADFASSVGVPNGAPEPWRRTWWEAATRAAIDVADALSSAHAQAVIHRDVKPSNVMLRRDGFALLFDFGLASVEDEATLTLTHGFVGTPHYASPEQAAGATDSLDPRTDVFSLGATLYEALTLHLPFPGPTTHEVLRRIQTWEPEPPAKLNAAVPKDLETVVLAALEKDRGKRYESAAAFADDLRAALAGKKVRARRAGLIERGLRSVKRGRALTDLLVEQQARNAELRSAVLRAEKNERLAAERAAEAERERSRAEAIAKFLKDMLAAADPSVEGRDVRVADLLDRAAARTSSLAGGPDVRAEIEKTIASTYFGLGLVEAARDLAVGAYPRAKAELPADSRVLWELASVVGASLAGTGDVDQAIAACREAAEGVARAFGDSDRDAVRFRADVAFLVSQSGRRGEAEPMLRAALADAESVLGESDETTLRARHNLAILLLHRTNSEEGLTLLREAFDGRMAALGARNPETLASMISLGQDLKRFGRVDEAAELLARGAALAADVLGPGHAYTASALHNLAGLRIDQGRIDEAVDLQRHAVTGAESCFTGTAQLGVMLAQLAKLLDRRGARDEALLVARRAAALLPSDARGAAADGVRRLLEGKPWASGPSPSG